MSLRELFSRFVLLPVGKTYAGRNYFKAIRYQRFLEKTQQWDRDEIRELRNRQFRNLMAHCYKNVPFYRQYMDKSRLTVNDFKTMEDVTKLPLLTKEILKENLVWLTATNYKRKHIRYNTSGGTTGIPAQFGIDLPNEYKGDGNNRRFGKYAGYTPGMKLVLFWAHPRELALTHSLHERLKNLMNNTIVLNAWDLSEQRLEEFTNAVLRYKPDVIRGYATAIHLYMQYCKSNGITFAYKPQSLIITSDKIYAPQKKALAEFFGCEVFEEYGCREFSSNLAHECDAHQGLHLAEEHFIFEVIDQQTGEYRFEGRGEIVVTPLCNYAVPLLRYRLGDEVTISPTHCSCGRSLRLISDLQGRVIDYVVTNSNTIVHGTFFLHLFGSSQGIARFQVHQHEKGKVVIYIVRNGEFKEKEINAIASNFKAAFNDDLTHTIKYVDEVEVSPSGKRRICISHIAAQYLSSHCPSPAQQIR